MTKYVYSYYNKKIGVYGDPILTPYDVDNMKEGCKRSVRMMSQEEYQKAAGDELELYYLGTFDDKTGVHAEEIKFICSFAEFR